MSDEERLAELFRSYREACPDPEPGADFMPGLWAKIEGRRRSLLTLRRWTGAFVAAAMALSLLTVVQTLQQADPGLHPFSYVETLGTDEPFETFAYGDVAYLEAPENPGLR